MAPRLTNSLHTIRKRSGLDQREVAFLLGAQNGAMVCRYERNHRVPPLQAAMALALIFGVSLATLFGGLHAEVKKNMAPRIEALRSKLEMKRGHGRGPALARKLHSLDELHTRICES